VPYLPPQHKKQKKEKKKREEQYTQGGNTTPAPIHLLSGTTSRNTTDTIEAREQGKDKTNPTPRNYRHNFPQHSAKAKKTPHPVRQNRSPKKPTPAQRAGVPSKSMPAAKTPLKNKRGYTNNNKKNAAYKVTIPMCKSSPNFFQKKFGIKFNPYYLRV